jgi:hypothetical protein
MRSIWIGTDPLSQSCKLPLVLKTNQSTPGKLYSTISAKPVSSANGVPGSQ